MDIITQTYRNLVKEIWRAALFVPMLSVCAYSQSLISRIGWRGASRGVMIGLAIFFITAICLLISIYFSSLRKRSKIEHEASSKLFKDGCARCRLTPEEIKTLRAVAAYAPDPKTMLHKVFDMRVLYERCVDSYVNNFGRGAHHGRSETDADEILEVLRKKLGYDHLTLDQTFLSTRNLSVGQKMSIFPFPLGSAHSVGCAASVTHVGEFYFTVRIMGGFGGVNFQFGSDVTIVFLRQGDASYNTVVKVRDMPDGGNDINFFHTLKFSRSQKRRYLRHDISLPLRYRVLESTADDVSINKPVAQALTAQTLDIGGGGLSFITNEMHLTGDVLLMAFGVGGKILNGVKARVLHVIPVPGHTEEDTRYRHMVQFSSIEPQQREHIIKFIFEKQREMMQMR